jgi:hypothetical protein
MYTPGKLFTNNDDGNAPILPLFCLWSKGGGGGVERGIAGRNDILDLGDRSSRAKHKDISTQHLEFLLDSWTMHLLVYTE